jgi:hypothetical protein
MKKTILCLLCSCFIFVAGYSQKINTPFDFPLKPGSAKWQELKSVQDMYNACQVPTAILSNLSTKALIQTCLNYPASAVLLVHNTPQQGFDTWRLNFNGIDALYKRPDGVQELLAVYAAYDLKGHNKLATDIEKGSYTFKIRILENILAQKDILTKLTEAQQKQLIKACLSHYAAMETDTVYGFAGLASAGRIIAGIASRQSAGKLKASVQSTEADQFIKSGLLTNREILRSVIDEAKKNN